MYKTARLKILFPIAIVAAFMPIPSVKAASGSSSVCNPSSACTVGEFVYDDSYAIITSATCSIKSRYPDGSVFLDLDNITSTSDGWYGYSFTAPAVIGYYRTQLCCNVDGQNMCLDKSFEVKEASASNSPSAAEIAEAVWSYSGRTLSSFGSLTADIWNYSGRTLSGFGSLVSSIWDHATRTLTGGSLSSGSLATKTDVENISKSINDDIKDIRLTLEKLVNKPIIQNFVEDDDITLESKLSQTKSVAETIFINTQFIKSKSDLLISRWNILSEDQILDILMEVKKSVGEKTDKDGGQTLFANINWLSSSWNWSEAKELLDQIVAVESTVSAVQSALAVSGKSKSSYYELKSLSSYISTLDKILGRSADSTSQKTVYGKINQMQSLALNLRKNSDELDKLITQSSFMDRADLESRSERLSKSVFAINKIPGGYLVLNSNVKIDDPVKRIKNKLLSLKALVVSNMIYLAKGPQAAFANTWLEEGSVVFKSLITNPSSLVKQTVPLKYYLPPEVKEGDILEADSGLSVKYDTEKGQYYVEGEFELAPGETKTISVRVDDIWIIPKDRIESLRKQAEELSRPLEKTAYFAQGVTLKSDINVSLDKILSLQKDVATPEQRIRAYREAQIELVAVNQKMDSLKTLVAQASSAGAYFGFAGGAQVLTVWGIVMVVVAGIILLFAYLKAGGGRKNSKSSKNSVNDEEKLGKKTSLALKVIPFILVGVFSAFVGGFIVKRFVLEKISEEKEESVGLSEGGVSMVSPSKLDEDGDGGMSIGGEEILKVKEGCSLKEMPDEDAKTVFVFDHAKEVVRAEQVGGWSKVAVKKGDGLSFFQEGWVKNSSLIFPD